MRVKPMTCAAPSAISQYAEKSKYSWKVKNILARSSGGRRKHRICKRLVYHQRQMIGYHHFLEESPGHAHQAAPDTVVIKDMLFIKLMEEMLRPLYGPCDQLRVKHYIQSVDTEMVLGLLLAAIHLSMT